MTALSPLSPADFLQLCSEVAALPDLTASPGYEESLTDEPLDAYDTNRPPSPPHASGGAYFGPSPRDPGPGHQNPPYTQGFTQHPNVATTNLNETYRPYNPQDYAAYQPPPPPPPPGPPPNSAATPTGMPPPPTGGHRSGPDDHDAAHVSSESPSSSINANVHVNLGGGAAKKETRERQRHS